MFFIVVYTFLLDNGQINDMVGEKIFTFFIFWGGGLQSFFLMVSALYQKGKKLERNITNADYSSVYAEGANGSYEF